MVAEPYVWTIEGLALALARGEITAEIFVKFSDLIPPAPNRDRRIAAALINAARPARPSILERFRSVDWLAVGSFAYLFAAALSDTFAGQIIRTVIALPIKLSGLIDLDQAIQFVQWSF